MGKDYSKNPKIKRVRRWRSEGIDWELVGGIFGVAVCFIILWWFMVMIANYKK